MWQKVGELNDTSIMNRVNYGTIRFIYGDTPVKNEGAILAAGYKCSRLNFKSGTIKVVVRHLAPNFKAVAPEYAVIQWAG